MDGRREVFCHADPLFYDVPAPGTRRSRDFELAGSPLPPGWHRAPLESWLMHWPGDVALAPQGWKVHVSACLDNADAVLTTVAAYCTEREIPFKYLRGVDHLLLANAKYADRGASGKFITIYPAEAEVERVLTDLDKALDGSPGPGVLSDLRWNDGPLSVRYGGFAERWCLSDTGTLVLAIEDPDGDLVPDNREPAFRPPPWVTLPAFLQPHLDARNSLTVDGLPYRIERALHFSNGGGLYVGEHRESKARVVLKEARPYAGLDVDGVDAVVRLHRERDVLERLAGLDVVPAVHGGFTLGEHHFLAIEYVDGTPLRTEIVERNPLAMLDAAAAAAAEYAGWALDVQRKVEGAVEQLHGRGVVVGDLHPFNMLLRPDGEVVLVDFEIAAGVEEGRRQSLADPGFAAPADRTGFDIDRYALACLRLFLFLPLTTLLGIDRGKATELAGVIAEQFPVPRDFLDEAVRVITGDPAATPRNRPLPGLHPGSPDWPRLRDALAGAVLASATPERDDRLFPGDIAQFSTGGLNIAHGAAGVLHALAVTGAGRRPELEDWLCRRAVSPAPGSRLGLYDGLHGVAHVLEHLGHRSAALGVIDIATTELAGRHDRLGTDLHGGLAGIGLTLADLATRTGDPNLRESALRVAQHVADRLGGEGDVAQHSGGRHPQAGLMHGSAGRALLFLRLYEQTGEPALLDLAATALRQDLRRCLSRPDGSLEVNEGWRTMPYLSDGSVGIGMVLDDYLTHRSDEGFATAAAGIRRAALSPLYVEPGLFHGRAGMVLALSRSLPPGTAAERDPAVAAQLRRLGWHAIGVRGGVAFPGEELMRLSMDLATGTAGVLLAAGAALHPEPVSLPFLAPGMCVRTPPTRPLRATGRR